MSRQPVGEPMAHSRSWDTAGPVEGARPEPWAVARDGLAGSDTYWLATVRPDGLPHAVPVPGVVVGDALHFCAGDRSRKVHNLARDPHCVVNARGSTMDLVVEGEVVAVADPRALARVAQAYQDKYGWRPEVRDGALWADGAPTAGPPPYRVYRVAPTTVLGLPTDGAGVPTRWRF